MYAYTVDRASIAETGLAVRTYYLAYLIFSLYQGNREDPSTSGLACSNKPQKSTDRR